MGEAIRKIALIDDDDAIRETIADILSSEGYRVVAYANGKEALDGLPKADLPDVILCDLMMPVMNGWQFLEAQASQRGEVGRIPVVVFSASPDYKTLEHEAVQEVVSKPFNIDDLVDLIERHCPKPREY